jgi:hypothetical protein
MKYPLSSVMCAANSLGDNSGLSNATLTVLSISLSGILFQNLLLFLSLGARPSKPFSWYLPYHL